MQRLPAEEECLWSREGSFTWQETYHQACRYAKLLQAQGIKSQELVAVYLQNSPEFIFSTLACWALGSAPAYINYNLAGDALIHCLRISGAKLVLVDADDICRSQIESSRDRIERGLHMKIIILDKKTKSDIADQKPERPNDNYRSGITPASPMALFYTRSVHASVVAAVGPISPDDVVLTSLLSQWYHRFTKGMQLCYIPYDACRKLPQSPAESLIWTKW